MDPEKLSQLIFRLKAALLLVCLAIILLVFKERTLALAVALAFMSLSSLGDIVLGFSKMKSGAGLAQSLLLPVIMFLVFMALSVFMLMNMGIL